MTLLAAALVLLAALARPGRRARREAPVADRGPAAEPVPEAVQLDLLCAALAVGLPPERALVQVLAVVGEAVGREPADRAGGPLLGSRGRQPWAPVDRAFALADRTGASAVTLLRAARADLLRERRTAARLAAARLGVLLVLPLGLTVLPAFALLGIAPVVMGIARGLLG
jgi:hypothetical protein